MKTVTLEVASREDVTRRALDAFKGKKQRARISLLISGAETGSAGGLALAILNAFHADRYQSSVFGVTFWM